MNGDKLLNIIGAIVTVALVTTIVARPNSVKVIRELGGAFSGAISSSLGKGVSFG
jgi:hypothetical protein